MYVFLAAEAACGEIDMRFIHASDMHLGAAPDGGRLYSKVRGQELWDTFARLLQVCEQERTDLLLISGDLFHRQPLMRELREVDAMFAKLSHTKVVMIAGNHDYLKKDSNYRKFVWNDNVHPLFDEELDYVILKELDVTVSGLSYDRKEIEDALFDKAKAPGKCRYEILLAHGGDAKHIPMNKEKMKGLGYDYIACGHIHKPHVFIEGKAFHAGALEPIDINDTGVHGYVEGELTENGLTCRFIPFAAREYVHLEIPVTKDMTNTRLKDLVRQEIMRCGVEHLYKLILTGFCSTDADFWLDELDVFGNVLDVQDLTKPEYDFQKLKKQNESNLLGYYIEHFAGAEEGSLEAEALYEGVKALLED